MEAVITATLARYHDVLEGMDHGIESYCETAAEHAGEVERFGDSWPGALLDLHAHAARLAQEARMAQALWRFLHRAGAEVGEMPFQHGLRLPGVRSPR